MHLVPAWMVDHLAGIHGFSAPEYLRRPRDSRSKHPHAERTRWFCRYAPWAVANVECGCTRPLHPLGESCYGSRHQRARLCRPYFRLFWSPSTTHQATPPASACSSPQEVPVLSLSEAGTRRAALTISPSATFVEPSSPPTSGVFRSRMNLPRSATAYLTLAGGQTLAGSVSASIERTNRWEKPRSLPQCRPGDPRFAPMMTDPTVRILASNLIAFTHGTIALKFNRNRAIMTFCPFKIAARICSSPRLP